MNQRDYAADLGALGYPSFAYVKGLSTADPAELLLNALNEPDLDSRIAEGLPWLVLTHAEMDWNWLVENARLQGRQNRLGFIVSLAAELAKSKNSSERASKLRHQLEILEISRLSKEDMLCRLDGLNPQQSFRKNPDEGSSELAKSVKSNEPSLVTLVRVSPTYLTSELPSEGATY